VYGRSSLSVYGRFSRLWVGAASLYGLRYGSIIDPYPSFDRLWRVLEDPITSTLYTVRYRGRPTGTLYTLRYII